MTMTKPQLVRHTSAGAKFKLLMWKNFLLQWRHPIQTCTEILIPVLTMTLVLLIRGQVEPHEGGKIMYPPLPANTLTHSTAVMAGMNTTRLSIAYSPTSPVLEEVVRSAMVNLFVDNVRQNLPTVAENLPNWPDITLPPPFESIPLPPEITLPPDIIYNIDQDNIDLSMIDDLIKALVRVEAYNSSNDLRGIYVTEDATKIVIAAVEFDDELLGSEELSQNLSYSLRFPERLRLHSLFQTGGREWKTDHVFPVYEEPGPRFAFSWEGGNDPGYVNEMFIALQQAISTELIAKLTGDDEFRSFKVNIQRLPHPEYLQDMTINVLQLMFPMFLMISFTYTAINIVRAVTVEKEAQIKGTMKLMGLSTWLHWTAWFFKQFIFLIIAAILIVIILKVNWFSNESGFSEYAVFTNTSWTVLFFYLLLYLSCTIFFCFMMSGIFAKASTAALITGVIWFMSYLPAFLITMDVDMSTTVQVLTCLSINSAMAYGFQLILARESVGGLQWGDFMTSPATESNRFVFGHVVIMMVVNCIVYMLIALYLEQVLPGPIGTPKPWYFPFQYSFWCPTKQDPYILVSNGIENHTLKEKDPIDHAVGVRIHNLTKTFGANIAVNNLSLNIYDDQITVLLGHNGAGKTTTISMLTGNLEATYGNINVAGYDMSTQTSIARSHIGLCSQHNVLFKELTVREHFLFFASLKGFKGAELHDEIDTLIEKLELQEKRDSVAKGLSGGQKRRLCVGIALSGAARVVLLDEPTSGMDPASRRGLWELLQREKKGRSMIMTTHFMDEADILGDRVAIMAHGQLQCIGSPYFLKRHYGVGYTLVVVKDNDFNYDECTALIEKYIPGIQIKEDSGTEVTFSLTNDYSFIYEQMLNDLETNIDTIKFKNYGLVATTLEDVFMTIGADLAPVNLELDDGGTVTTNSIKDAHKVEIESTLEECKVEKHEDSVSGFLLIVQRVTAIWMKQWLVLSRSWLMIILFVTPILIINTMLVVLQLMRKFLPTIQMRHLTLAQGFTGTETLLSYNGTSLSALGALASAAYRSMFENSGLDTMDITDIGDQPMEYYYLNRTNDPLDMRTLRHRILIGSTFDENSATAWFSNFGYHDVAISLAAVHSALLKAKNETAILNVCNHPLEATYTNQNEPQPMMVTLMTMQLASSIGSSAGIVSSVFIMFYIKERMSGAKLLQKAAGISPVVLWGSASMFDWAWFLITCISILLSCMVFDFNGLSTAPELGRLYLTFMVYGAAMLPLTYLMSHLFKGPALGFVSLFFLNVLLGNLGALLVDALSTVATTTQKAAVVLDYILQFFPLYSLVTSVRY